MHYLVASSLTYKMHSTFGAAILKVVYGISIAEKDDKYIAAMETVSKANTDGTLPGKFMVEFLPFLRHVPAQFPGASYRTLFETWRTALNNASGMTNEYTLSHIVSALHLCNLGLR